MDEKTIEKRKLVRNYVEPYDSGTWLVFQPGQREYTFRVLDTSPGGMGMLVWEGEKEALDYLKPGEWITMEYVTPEASMSLRVKIRHISAVKSGQYKGNYQVGVAVTSED
jgi:hypothetical protein